MFRNSLLRLRVLNVVSLDVVIPEVCESVDIRVHAASVLRKRVLLAQVYLFI